MILHLLVPKNSWFIKSSVQKCQVQKNLFQKYFGSKKFWSKEIFGQKRIWVLIMFVKRNGQKLFASKRIFVKKFGVRKNAGPKNIMNNFVPICVLISSICLIPILKVCLLDCSPAPTCHFFGPKIFRSKKTLGHDL